MSGNLQTPNTHQAHAPKPWSTTSYHGKPLEEAPLDRPTHLKQYEVIPQPVTDAFGRRRLGIRVGKAIVGGKEFVQVQYDDSKYPDDTGPAPTMFASADELQAERRVRREAFDREHPSTGSAAVHREVQPAVSPSPSLEELNVKNGLPADFHHARPRPQIVDAQSQPPK